MAKTYNVTLYRSSLFDNVNRPASVDALPNTFYTVPAVYLRQDKYISIIRVDTTWEEVQDVDYARLDAARPKFFLVTSISMLTDHTAELSLLYDPILSCGGIAALHVSGWLKRGHVSNDDLFANTVPEPWQPQEYLIIRDKKTCSFDTENAPINPKLLVATVNVNKADDFEADIARVSNDIGNPEEDFVVWPKLPIPQSLMSSYTVCIEPFVAKDLNIPNNKRAGIAGQYVFPMTDNNGQLNSDVIQNIQDLRFTGIDTAIVTAYQIPTGAIARVISMGNIPLMSDEPLLTVVGANEEFYVGNYEYGPAGDIYNKKTYAMYNRFTALSITSGSSIDFDAHDLYKDYQWEAAPVFRMWADPSPSGTVHFGPLYYQKSPCSMVEHTIQGLPWVSVEISTQGQAGATLAQANVERKIYDTNRQLGYRTDLYQLGMVSEAYGLINGITRNNPKEAMFNGLVDTVGSIASGDIPGATKSGVGMLSSGRNALRAQVDSAVNGALAMASKHTSHQSDLAATQAANREAYIGYQEAQAVAPTINVPGDINVQSYFGQDFILYQVGLTDNDLKRFDHFLTLYGYSLSCEFTDEYLSNRTLYNFIEASEAYVECSAPQSERQMISDIFRGGVRLWHVPPTYERMRTSDNPIVSGGDNDVV